MAASTRKTFIRPDGLEKVTGQGQYAADLSLPGLVHGRLLQAKRPHARIKRIDTSRARELPGVLAVITQSDLPPVRYGPFVKDRTLFAQDVVRFEGETVAAVAALSRETATAACNLIDVEYEPLEPILNPEAALTSEALVHPDWSGYAANDELVRDGNDCGYVSAVKGDIDTGFAEADEIVEERYVTDMSHPAPIEPHALLAKWHGDNVTIWSSTQVPFPARAGVAETLGIAEGRVRIIVPHLGGGFGGKCDVHFEPHVAALARAAGRPVKMVFDRREVFVATDMVRHPIVIELKTGVRRDGTITARQARLVLDTGAYAAHGPAITEIATMMAAGPYRIPHLLVEGYTVYTNKTPAGSTRAPAGPQVCWAVEQHTDVLAERVGMDPFDFRMLNLVEDGDEGPTGQVLDAVGVKECLEKAAELLGWGTDLVPNEGIGLSCGWWFSATGTSSATVRLNIDGTATIITGAQECGSGAVMGLPLLAAEVLALEPEQISLLYQDTGIAAFDGGASGSQTTFNNGRAVIAAAEQARDRLIQLAAEDLEASSPDLEISAGTVSVRGDPSSSQTFADVLSRAQDRGHVVVEHASPPPPPLPDGSAVANCAGRVLFATFVAPSFFCQAARVRVDRDTGVVRVKEVAAVHDFGRVLNPVGAEGQIEGGVAHGLGNALSEGTAYQDGFQLNPNFLDYKLQTSADVPTIRIAFVDRPAPDGPRGMKGAGEPPVVPGAGAVGNAIAAATGKRIRQMPMTPDRVWAALAAQDN